jgi:hypothetical protein
MFNEINPINSGVSSLRGAESFQSPSVKPGSGSSETSLIRNFDMVDVGAAEQGEESDSSNLQALRNSFSLNQGFEQGVQPSFAFNSSSGETEGLEQGIRPAGVFKSPQE